MRILICMSVGDDVTALTSLLADHPSVRFEVHQSVGDAFEILRRERVDAFLVDAHHMDQALTVRRADALVVDATYKIVLVDAAPTVTRVVRASQYGFDGVIDPRSDHVDIVAQLGELANGTRSVHVHPLIGTIGVIPGLFTRTLEYDTPGERDVVELLSLGLDDRDISTALGKPIQTVRNDISRLLHTHGLSTRTQLAALHIRGEVGSPSP